MRMNWSKSSCACEIFIFSIFYMLICLLISISLWYSKVYQIGYIWMFSFMTHQTIFRFEVSVNITFLMQYFKSIFKRVSQTINFSIFYLVISWLTNIKIVFRENLLPQAFKRSSSDGPSNSITMKWNSPS